MPGPDAVLVLGGGVRDNGALPPWVVRRFDKALELAGGATIVCLSAGTTHRPPPLSAQGFPVFESAAGARHLLERGVAPERIQVEAASYDTIGNAYFSKLLHVDPPGWRKLLVITSEFHMPRSRAIFEWVYGMEPNGYRLEFAASSNEGFAGRMLERRLEKEDRALELLQPVMSAIQDPRALHRWLFSGHNAYNAVGWTSRRASPPELVEIY